ncbi:hypothetical protein J1N35_010223 [Gossypium stocksii]|uniref:Uncharacterized protein n=1 Tax=Gossypium stocksii TaxID=47602 RepID=A0A9D4ACE4_9ROSI|nr:hypothetical protein J1N35_010223 [Gossypium stocksii]
MVYSRVEAAEPGGPSPGVMAEGEPIGGELGVIGRGTGGELIIDGVGASGVEDGVGAIGVVEGEGAIGVDGAGADIGVMAGGGVMVVGGGVPTGEGVVLELGDIVGDADGL